MKDKDFFSNSMQFSCISRYCDQNMFNILTFDRSTSPCPKLVRYDISNKELKSVKDFPRLRSVRGYLRTVFLKGNFYVFCGNNVSCWMSVLKYSSRSKTWKILAEYSKEEYISGFNVCVFMGKVYLIGGTLHLNRNRIRNRNCFEFDPVDKVREVQPTNEQRYDAACTVFEGKVVASGGGCRHHVGRTVETYDHVADTWSYMPNMIKRRSRHDLVAIKNKLFVFGGAHACEVYDSCCKTFSLLKSPPNLFEKPQRLHSKLHAASAVSMGDKIVVFDVNKRLAACYDVNKEQWSEGVTEMNMDALIGRNGNGCVKLPQNFKEILLKKKL